MRPPHKNNSEVYSAYGGDLRETPAYSITDAAYYLGIPIPTLRSWVKGRYYPVGKDGERRFFKPAIILPDKDRPQLSFINLIEAHVLDGMRRQHSVPFYNIRSALEYLKDHYPANHPLAEHAFLTDGFDLFIEGLSDSAAVNVSRRGQLEMIVKNYLRHVDRDLEGIPARLYPFVRKERPAEEPKVVMIDPLVSFGRPVLVGTGIPTAIIAERFDAGDSTDVLAQDYDRERSEIEEAVRYERLFRKAA